MSTAKTSGRTVPKPVKKQPVQKKQETGKTVAFASVGKRSGSASRSSLPNSKERRKPIVETKPRLPSPVIKACVKSPPRPAVTETPVTALVAPRLDFSATSSSTQSLIHQSSTARGSEQSPIFSPPAVTPPEYFVMKVPVPLSVTETPLLRAKLRLVESLDELSVVKVLEIKQNCVQTQSVEAVFSCLHTVLVRLDKDNVFAGASYYTWRTFQRYLQSPSQLVELLLSSQNAVQTALLDAGEFYPELIASVKERLSTLSPETLDSLGRVRLFYDYLQSLIQYSESVDPASHPSQPSEAEVPSRKKLLSSLYDRVFHSAESDQVARIFQSSREMLAEETASAQVSFCRDLNTSMSTITKEADSRMDESLFQSLNFSRVSVSESVVISLEKQEEPSLGDCSLQVRTYDGTPEKPKSILKSPQKRVVPDKSRPKSSVRLAVRQEAPVPVTVGESAQAVRFYWELESAFRRFMREKVDREPIERIVRNRVEVISEFQVEMESTVGKTVPAGVETLWQEKALELYAELSNLARFKAEVKQAALSCVGPQVAKGPKSLNWMQQQVLREKEKLAKGMSKYSRRK